jgi:hypothetical protein
MASLTLEQIKDIQQKLKGPDKKLDLYVTLYTRQLGPAMSVLRTDPMSYIRSGSRTSYRRERFHGMRVTSKETEPDQDGVDSPQAAR